MPQLFAVLCPTTRDYFLVHGREAYSAELRSKRTGEVVPLDDRYVQWMPNAHIRWLSTGDVGEIARALDGVGGLRGELTRKDLPTYVELEDEAAGLTVLSASAIDDTEANAAIATEVANVAELRARAEFQRAFADGHRYSFDIVGDNVYVFSVGTAPGLLLGVPVLASTTSSGVDVAKDIGLGVAIFLELLDMLGRFVGLPPNTSRSPKRSLNGSLIGGFLKFSRSFSKTWLIRLPTRPGSSRDCFATYGTSA